jgi:Predicted integral membrane protein (DUF2269)
MNWYDLALFFHVSGVIGVWITLGVWLFGLAALRRAQRVEQVRALAWLIIVATPFMLLNLALLGVAGFYMALTVWGLQTDWIVVSLVSMLLIGPIGAFVLDRRMHTILAQARETMDGPLSSALAARVRDPLLVTGAQTMAAILLGNVFLMTTKPPFSVALLVMGGAVLLGILSNLPVRWRATPSAASADPFQRQSIWTRRF